MYQDVILKALEKASGKTDINLSVPEISEHGDYSTNIVLGDKNPRERAEELVSVLKKDKKLSEVVDRIEVAGPGFINFWLKKKSLKDNLSRVLDEGIEYGESDENKGVKIMVEFAHPNTHKQVHIGHLRNITTGESLCRILQSTGCEVIRVNYQGDVGLHIAKALWGLIDLKQDDPDDLKGKIALLGKAYIHGNKEYEENSEAKKEIIKLNKDLYSKKSGDVYELYQKTRKWSLDYFDSVYARLYTKFDRLYFESEVYESGLTIARKALKSGVLTESKGAVVYRGEQEGLHTRVFITGEGNPTYEGKELGLAELQFSEYNPDKVIHVVGPEQSGYFQVLFRVLEKLYPDTKGKEMHVPYGWVKLKEGKMSSRAGNVVLAEWLLDEIKKAVVAKFESVEDAVAEKVAVAAAKYSFLKMGREQELAFDINESVSVEGNSGPYLQYTHARAKSVVSKYKTNTKKYSVSDVGLDEAESQILRDLTHFHETIVSAAKTYSPNILCNYLYRLAQDFNTFYNKEKIIGSDKEEFLVALTAGTAQVLANGLNLLGIQAPERM